ncbi:MAG: peptidoglycan editing factor PgeF [Bacillota bacterium]
MSRTGAFPADELESGPVVIRMAALEEALPGTLAVFSTRLGGVSSPPWDTLNLGYHVGDSPVDVTENRRRLLRALGVEADSLAAPAQVHGDGVKVVHAPGRYEDADGLLTLVRGLTLAVSCADCVPVYLLDPRTPAAGLVHAGWKGTLAGIAARAAETMVRRFGSRRSELVATIGPAIGPCCYEVGPEVAGPAEERFGSGAVRRDEDGRSRFNLWEANRLNLLSAGLDRRRVHVSGLCTFCREDLFHSHRRATLRGPRPPRSGRMMGLMRLPLEGRAGMRGEETSLPRKN